MTSKRIIILLPLRNVQIQHLDQLLLLTLINKHQIKRVTKKTLTNQAIIISIVVAVKNLDT